MRQPAVGDWCPARRPYVPASRSDPMSAPRLAATVLSADPIRFLVLDQVAAGTFEYCLILLTERRLRIRL